MISESMIVKYLEYQKFHPILRKTRLSTNKIYQNNIAKLENIETKGKFKHIIFRLNGNNHHIKVLPNEEIIDVSCFCIGTENENTQLTLYRY